MSQQPARRRRRRALWLVGALALLLLGGTAYATVSLLLAPEAPKAPSAATRKPEEFAVVSPPLAGTEGQKNPATPGGTPAAAGQPAGGSGSGTTSATGPGSSNGQGNGSTNGQAVGKSLDTSVVSVSRLYPGVRGRLVIRVSNTNAQDVVVTDVASAITSVTSAGIPGLQACQTSWFSIGALPAQVRIAGRGTADLTLPVSMSNTATINQDNCKASTFRFSFTVNGRQA